MPLDQAPPAAFDFWKRLLEVVLIPLDPAHPISHS
jgi:hypothetical protein